LEGIADKNHIINTGDSKRLKTGLKRARHILLSGGVVAFPTESFYGLGVNALDEKAIQRLFKIKQRDKNHPILILIPSLDSLNRFVIDIPELAFKLMDHYWPGGLTLVFKAGHDISTLLTANTDKIGVRLSSHHIATALAQTIDNPITGTSANISGQSPCTNTTEVSRQMGMDIDLILDGGKTQGGMGSTILDVTVNPPKLLREGMITIEQLSEFF
jgi:L-threonylcarbamoyladenylate synthase